MEEVGTVKFSRKITDGPWPWGFPQVLQCELDC